MPNKDNEFYEKWCIQNKFDWQDRFLTTDGRRADYEMSSTIKDTGFAKLKFIEDKTGVQGRYEVYCKWKGGGAHVFIVERQKDGNLLWFDPQSSRRGGWKDFNDGYINMMRYDGIGILRIDDKLINPQFAKRLIKASK